MNDLLPGSDETLDHLGGGWWILQLARGHRFSTDDLVCAWHAASTRPDARRLLDLGSGIGSVGLATLRRMSPDATLVTIEAQEASVALARRTVRRNGLAARVDVRHGDLRDVAVLPADAAFDLITGSPPYVPVGHGLVSPHPQRAHCRIELRGSVFDYCAAARRHLAPGGRFVYVMAAADPRTEDAPARHGLVVVERVDYVFRWGREPHVATVVCAREEDVEQPAGRRTRHVVVRGADGQPTSEYLALRDAMGLPDRRR